jgi:NAD+ diphosphatase
MSDSNSFPVNFFISNNLDRFSEKRLDEGWIKEKLTGPNSYIIPVYKLKVLLFSDDDFHAVLLNPGFFNNINDSYENFIFLGSINDKHYFCVNIENIGLAEENFLELGTFRELRQAAPLLDNEKAAILAYSKAMVYWHKYHLYCGHCGYPTKINSAGHRRVCSNPDCGVEHFPRTDPAIIVLVSHGDKCLLARQPHWRKGQYATIAGFVEPGESLEQAVAREVFEETGVILNDAWYRSSQPWPFPASIMLGFRAESKNTEINLRDHELEDARWYSRDEIKNGLKDGNLKLSPKVSISFRLIEEWFDQENKGKLISLLNSL